MRNKLLIVALILTSSLAIGQVKDISVTFSPAVEYTFWDDKAGLDDGILYGGKVGFGFGEYVELRATYMRGYDLVTNFEDFGLARFSDGLIPERDVELTRWGGEFKANFGTRTKLNPYFTLGAGVQTLQLEDFDEQEQIFATLGLGAKFNLGKRIVFALEAKNTVYNFNSGARLLTQNDRNNLGVTTGDFETERLSNWSAMASLEFYLSGRRPGELSELDKAYLNTFASGFRGLRLTLEPSLAHVDFDSDSRFRDAWFLGGYVGVDFNDYIGLRAFYFKATNDDELSTDFDNLQMYGGEFRARLNVPRGVVPYLSLGGGYLDVTDNYQGINGFTGVNDSYFASGGLGLNVPLSKEVVAFGGAKALLTSDTDEEDIQNPDRIQTHIMYNFGIKFNIGRSSNAPKDVYQRNVDENVNAALATQREENQQKITALKADYKKQIVELEDALKKANENNDPAEALKIIEEKNELKKALKEVEDVERTNQLNDTSDSQKFETLKADYGKRIEELEKKLEKSNEDKNMNIANQLQEKESNEQNIDALKAYYNNRISELETELEKAIREKDVENAVKLIEEKNAYNTYLKEVENKNYQKTKPSEEMILITPLELELLINRFKDNAQRPATEAATQQLYENQSQNNTDNEALKQRVDALEALLMQRQTENLNPKPSSVSPIEKQSGTDPINTSNPNDLLRLEILSKLNELNSKVDSNTSKINLIDNNAGLAAPATEQRSNQEDRSQKSKNQTENSTNQEDTDDGESFFSRFTYKNTSAMLGIMLVSDPFPVASLRMNYTIADSKIEFMPEVFLGATDPLSFGLSVNAVRPLELKQNPQIKPYIGAGLGYMRIYDDGKLNANIILGSYINVFDGKLYIDYTIRNFFNYNQISAGYQLNF